MLFDNTTIKFRYAEAVKASDFYSAFLSFPYNDKIINIIRTLPERYWNTSTKEWEIPNRLVSQAKNELKAFTIIEENADKNQIVTKETKKPHKKVNSEFNFKTQPFNHQVDGFNYGLTHDKWILGDEQGLGKTKQVIDIAVAKKQNLGYKHCLIICGVNGLKWNWREEIKTHSNETSWILGQRANKKGKITIGSTADKLADLQSLSNTSPNAPGCSGAYFLITNVESLRVKEIVAEIVNLCVSKQINIIAMDEAHKCKSPSSQQGKGLLKINAESMICMTGTPLMNSPLDLFVLLKWIGVEKHNFFQFKNYYCMMGGFGGYQVVGYKHLDELQDQLSNVMLRRLKSDVLDLPEKIFTDEFVEMGTLQSKVYKEVSEEIKASIDKIVIANNPLAELIRLRQATGYTGILSSSVCESAKLDRLEELIEEIIANGKKCVIFSNWKQITDIVSEKLHNYNSVVITGDTRDEDRQIFVNRFQTDDRCKLAIGTIGAMGTGITLTAASTVIFMDEPWTMADKNQAVDRCHRIGTTETVNVITLLTKDTIDERVHSIVEKKGEMSKIIVDGKLDMTDKRELVNFLLS